MIESIRCYERGESLFETLKWERPSNINCDNLVISSNSIWNYAGRRVKFHFDPAPPPSCEDY